MLTKDDNRNTRQRAEVYKTVLQGLDFPLHTNTVVANAVTVGAAARFSADKICH